MTDFSNKSAQFPRRNQKTGVAIIVIYQGSVLLGKRKNSHGSGTFGMPGGHLEAGETLEQCAKRELLEETGMILEKCSPPYCTYRWESANEDFISYFMIAEEFSGEPKLIEPDKCEGWQWHPWDNLPLPLFSPITYLLQEIGVEELKRVGM